MQMLFGVNASYHRVTLITPVFIMPRLFGPLARESAEGIICDMGMFDGLFLVREKKIATNEVTFALSYSYNKKFTHHLLQKKPNEPWMLDTSKFENRCIAFVQLQQSNLYVSREACELLVIL